MGPEISFARFVFSARPARSLVLCAAALVLSLAVPPAFAAEPPEAFLDATALVGLEQRAATAEPKERCYLYTELLHNWTELAGRAMTNGDETEAAKAIAHADADVAQLKSALANDSKRLKNAELLLEHTAHRMSDMVRVASMEQHDTMQAVLKHLNSVHDALLAQIFAR